MAGKRTKATRKRENVIAIEGVMEPVREDLSAAAHLRGQTRSAWLRDILGRLASASRVGVDVVKLLVEAEAKAAEGAAKS